MQNEKKDFNEEFEKALSFLQTDSSDYLSVVEKITDNYLQSNANFSTSLYVNYQVQLYELIKENASPIVHYLKRSQPIAYNGPNKQAFRRIEKLRKISYFHFAHAEGAVGNPNKIQGTMFSFNENHPWEMNLVILRQDGNFFNLVMEMNDALNFNTQLVENMKEKLTSGANNIDTNQYDILVEKFEDFKSKMNETLENIKRENEK